MLSLVRRALLNLNLVGAADRLHMNVILTDGDVLLLNVYSDEGGYWHIRLSEGFDLEREYRVGLGVAERFKAFVPRPLGYFQDGPTNFIVTEGVTFNAVRPEDFFKPADRSTLVSSLLEFVDLGGHQTWTEEFAGGGPTSLEAQLRARFRGSSFEDIANRVLASPVIDTLRTRTPVPQHGDLSLNNLGLHGGQLVVFDWEDFGKVCMPGFDLAVLVCSAVGLDPKKVSGIVHGDDAATIPWLREACNRIKLDEALFRQSIPFHLLGFLMLKDQYSTELQIRLRRVIQDLVLGQ